MAAFEMDTGVRLSAVFTTVQGGALTDPTEVKLFVKPPTGSVTTYTLSGAQIVKDSTGNYHYDLMLTNVGGNWNYKWQGTGTVQCTSGDGTLTVNNSVFVAQL